MRIDTSRMEIDPRVLEKSLDYITAFKIEANKHDEFVLNNPQANKKVLEVLKIALRTLPNDYPCNKNQGLTIKCKVKNAKPQLIPNNPDHWTMTSMPAQETIKNLSDFWDSITGFGMKLSDD